MISKVHLLSTGKLPIMLLTLSDTKPRSPELIVLQVALLYIFSSTLFLFECKPMFSGYSDDWPEQSCFCKVTGSPLSLEWPEQQMLLISWSVTWKQWPVVSWFYTRENWEEEKARIWKYQEVQTSLDCALVL